MAPNSVDPPTVTKRWVMLRSVSKLADALRSWRLVKQPRTIVHVITFVRLRVVEGISTDVSVMLAEVFHIMTWGKVKYIHNKTPSHVASK